jgi:hypothetical protein
MFDLPKKMLTNEKIKGGHERELYQVVQSMVGAIALWAGEKPAFHFLEILKIIKKRKAADSKEEEKQQIKVSNHDAAHVEYEFSSHEEKQIVISSESDGKLHSPPKDD